MATAIFNIVRRPLEGQSKKLLESAIGIMTGHGMNGNVTSSLTSFDPTAGIHVTSTLNFQSLSGLEELQDSFYSNEEMQDAWDETALLCKSVSTTVLEVVVPPENVPDNPKYMLRTIATAKRGKREELIDLALSMRDRSSSNKAGILKPMNSFQRIRLTRVYGSLEDLSAAINVSNAEYGSTLEKFIALTDSVTRSVSRIHYLNR